MLLGFKTIKRGRECNAVRHIYTIGGNFEISGCQKEGGYLFINIATRNFTLLRECNVGPPEAHMYSNPSERATGDLAMRAQGQTHMP